MTGSDNQRGRVWAALLSLPSIIAIAVIGAGKIAASLGSPVFDHFPIVGGVVIITFILIPFCTVILVGWAIARWANHGEVPPWLLAAAVGNALAFWMFYEMTTM